MCRQRTELFLLQRQISMAASREQDQHWLTSCAITLGSSALPLSPPLLACCRFCCRVLCVLPPLSFLVHSRPSQWSGFFLLTAPPSTVAYRMCSWRPFSCRRPWVLLPQMRVSVFRWKAVVAAAMRLAAPFMEACVGYRLILDTWSSHNRSWTNPHGENLTRRAFCFASLELQLLCLSIPDRPFKRPYLLTSVFFSSPSSWFVILPSFVALRLSAIQI